jgi:prepilin-type N-terminal cleavage/methylation domain-containing protein
MPRYLRRWQQRGGDDAGFTLVELLVAMTVTLVVMSALLGVFVQSLKTVSEAKQRQAATGLATRVLEQLRALPYDTVTGVGGAALAAGDPNVVYSTPPRFRPPAIAGVDEPLVVNTVSPKLTTETVDGVAYQVRQYVGRAPATGDQQPYTLTTLVTWTPRGKAPVTTAQRSAVYSPSGCLSTALRPYSGPCQAYFTAQAGQSAAGISVTNLDDSTAEIPGFTGSRIALGLPLLSAGMLLEQTTAATSLVATTEGTTGSGDTTARTGGRNASTAVDSDPSSTPGQTATATTAAQTSTALTLSGPAGTLRTRPTPTDTGSASSAVAAEPAMCPAATATSATLTTGATGARRPCAAGSVQPAGSTPGALTYDTAGSLGIGTAQVVSLAAAPSPARAVAAHLTASNTDACPGTSGVGCSHAQAYRALGAAVVGGLPAGGGLPSTFAGSWRVSNLVETARSERGVSARAPAYTRSGTLEHWNGSGYTAVTLAAGTDQSITVPTAVWTGASAGRAVRIEVASTIRVRPAAVPAPSGPADCKAQACTASAGAPGGVAGDTTYRVFVDGQPFTSFRVTTDLGGLITEASYRAAPDA